MTYNGSHIAAMDRLIDRLDRLHTAPAVACQVLRLLQDDEFDSSELVRYLETDPALASAIMAFIMGNSALGC